MVRGGCASSVAGGGAGGGAGGQGTEAWISLGVLVLLATVRGRLARKAGRAAASGEGERS
jgi:hypothetical protein